MVVTVEELIKKVRVYNNNAADISKIRNAYECAYELHRGQFRKSGEEYIIHPLTVAYILTDMHVDCDTLCAALLHDTIEDTDASLEYIEKLFNHDVAFLVNGLTKIKKMEKSDRNELNNANMRKIIISITEDVRIIIIKLADRLHNMRTLGVMRPDKQKRIARETLNFYVNLAKYLGAYKIKEELEDLSFYYINKDEYDRIFKNRNKTIFKNENYLCDMKDNLIKCLNSRNIISDGYIKYKNVYGIYKQLLADKRLSDIHNLLSIVLTTDSKELCYLIVGIVHDLYKPIDSEFRDYICRPKANMYSSLHTTVFGENNNLVQIKIRTNDMDNIANNGIAAYWDLCMGDVRDMMQKELERKYQFFDSLVQINKTFTDNNEFARKISDELFSDMVHVYTSNGGVIELPAGSTIVDYVYKLGYESVNNIFGAAVNGEIMDVNYVLRNDDWICLIENKYVGGPKISWEDFAKTTIAREKIRALKLEKK